MQVCGQVRILSEDFALHIPRDAFGHLASVLNFQSGKAPSFISELEGCEVKLSETLSKQQVSEDHESHDARVERRSEDYARDFQTQSLRGNGSSMQEERDQGTAHHKTGSRQRRREEMPFYGERDDKRLDCFRKRWALDASKCLFQAQRSAWPHWVYRMYDAYDLARHAAGTRLFFTDPLPSVFCAYLLSFSYG